MPCFWLPPSAGTSTPPLTKGTHVPERIFAFAVPLGPAHPGLIHEEKRKQDARQIVRAMIPSTASLIGAGLEERITSDGRLIWLAFDLVESPQLSLAFNRQRGKRTIQPAPVQRLIAELAKLQEDTETTTIRLGELEQLAQVISHVSSSEAQSLLSTLSEEERRLWQLAHSKRGARVSVAFENQKIEFTLPLFPVHVSDTKHWRIRFQVTSPSRKAATITGVRILDDETENAGSDIDSVAALTRLLRSPGVLNGDGWFGLYAAEYCNRHCEATVRVARRAEDLSPSHFELVQIDNLLALRELGMKIFTKP